MRNTLAFIGLVVVVFAVVGYFRNWYTINWTTGSDGKVQVNTNIDTHKIRDDGTKAEQGVEDLVNKNAKDVNSGTKAPASLPGPMTK